MKEISTLWSLTHSLTRVLGLIENPMPGSHANTLFWCIHPSVLYRPTSRWIWTLRNLRKTLVTCGIPAPIVNEMWISVKSIGCLNLRRRFMLLCSPVSTKIFVNACKIAQMMEPLPDLLLFSLSAAMSHATWSPTTDDLRIVQLSKQTSIVTRPNAGQQSNTFVLTTTALALRRQC